MPAGPPLLRGPFLLLFLLLFLLFLGAPARGAVYTNHFLVELHGGGQAEAERVAAEHGFGGVRKVSPRAGSGRWGGAGRRCGAVPFTASSREHPARDLPGERGWSRGASLLSPP